MPLNWADAASLAMEELKTQTDRGAAIVGGAMVDDCLMDALCKKLNKRRKSDKDAAKDVEFLSTNDGPLMSTKSRSALAYLMGIIGPETRSDLTYIAKIRNRFAHWVLSPGNKSIQPVTFEDPTIASWIDLLNAPKHSGISWDFGADESGRPVPIPKEGLRRRKFTYAVITIWLGLELGGTTRRRRRSVLR
jgi:DNA-binding MltR family transcriptional regulator